jgi:hypothetical protein
MRVAVMLEHTPSSSDRRAVAAHHTKNPTKPKLKGLNTQPKN